MWGICTGLAYDTEFAKGLKFFGTAGGMSHKHLKLHRTYAEMTWDLHLDNWIQMHMSLIWDEINLNFDILDLNN